MADLINRRDVDFLLYELLNIEELLEAPRFADWDRQAIDQIIDTAETVATEHFAPLAPIHDENEPKFENGRVVDLPEVADAIAAHAEAGFLAAGFDQELGGLQLPVTICQATTGYFQAANPALSGYPLLTVGNANVIAAFGSEQQKSTYLPPMLEGRWLGTMCLSEPQAGSSLSDVRTKAEPAGDGTYRVTGTKMWISNGENAFSENIIHLVLAKIPGGPPGVKGISLFIVPKIGVNQDGSLGDPNNVSLAGLNHKMGQRGLPNTLLNFGESGDCIGYLVGEEHKGLFYMFQMMNEARLGVGQLATMSGYAGYLYSLEYAMERPQGRPIANKDPESPQVMIIEHADIRRLLLAQKAAVEGALALILYCASLVDRERIVDKPEEKAQLNLLLEILTPMAKSWPSEFCLEANKHAIQVLGGYGYTREYPVERLYRDNRLNPIHEGAHGIHGIDLLGRKVRMADGAALKALLGEIDTTLSDTSNDAELTEYREALIAAVSRVTEATATLLQEPNIELSLANATIYLDALGHVVIAWIWLKQAQIASAKLTDENNGEDDFYAGKLAACRYFFRYELPKAVTAFDLLESRDDTTLNVTPGQFA